MQKLVTLKMNIPQLGHIAEDASLQPLLNDGWKIKRFSTEIPIGSRVSGPNSNRVASSVSSHLIVVVALLEKED